jgi:uncharacterized protein (TIGR02996 family)
LPPEAGPFLAAIAETPDDPHPRLVFADWLEEQGRPGAAAACRWLAAGNRPEFTAGDPLPWEWYAHDEEVREDWSRRGCDPWGMLPAEPVFVLPGRPEGCRHGTGPCSRWWEFPTREAAERELLEAWPDTPGAS